MTRTSVVAFRYCLLVLAWASIVNKFQFQGFMVGFQQGGLINHIITSLYNFDWENMSIYSLCFNEQSKDNWNCNGRQSTSIPFGFILHRINWGNLVHNSGHKKDGEMCLMVSRLDAWCKYLQEKSEQMVDTSDAVTLDNMKAHVMKE